MHTFNDILKAKKYLLEKGYNFDSEFKLLIVAELMAEWAAKNCSIPAVQKSVCKHEWIMTADSFDQTCYCKICGKSYIAVNST
jgi:hypothetical protein